MNIYIYMCIIQIRHYGFEVKTTIKLLTPSPICQRKYFIHTSRLIILLFKVGTLDTLVGLSDDLGKLDLYCEA